MEIQQVIEILLGQDQTLVLPFGIGECIAYRGEEEDDLLFIIKRGVAVASMIESLADAVDMPFNRALGGSCTGAVDSTVWIGNDEFVVEKIGPGLLMSMISLGGHP